MMHFILALLYYSMCLEAFLMFDPCSDDPESNTCLKKEINDLKLQMNKLKANTGSIAFMAILTNSINSPVVGLQLKYDDVKVNSGAGYNKNHGNFVAPVNGSYFFSFTASVKPDGGSLRIYMKKSDGSIVGHLLFLGNTFYVKESENIVIHLNKGEEVWTEIGMTSGTIHIHGTEEDPVSTYIHTHFSGFRIGD